MDKPKLACFDYTDRDFSKRLVELRFHVDAGCNYACIFCLQGPRRPRSRRMSMSDYRAVLDQARDLGARTIAVTGEGEPFLFSGLYDLLESIHGRGMASACYTNGSLLSAEDLRRLSVLGTCLILKLNSLDPEKNDKIVGYPGATRRTMENLAALERAGFMRQSRVSINTMILPQNLGEITEIFRFCRSKGIVPWIEAPSIVGKAGSELFMSAADVEKIFEELSLIDRKEFGIEWKSESMIMSVDRRRYEKLCQIDAEGNFYHTDSNRSLEIGNVLDTPLAILLESPAFKKLVARHKHSKDFSVAKGIEEKAEETLRALVSRKFRAGPLPGTRESRQLQMAIIDSVNADEPVPILQFWGGAKNPNLPLRESDACERETLDFLSSMRDCVSRIYPPGLRLTIVPGDARVVAVNGVSESGASAYVESLRRMVGERGYDGFMTVRPLSEYYREKRGLSDHIYKAKAMVRARIGEIVDLDRLRANAGKNMAPQARESEEESRARALECALDYIAHRIAEEEEGIFAEHSGAIRAFFIRYQRFYHELIADREYCSPPLGRSIYLRTGRHGNITQPWQAMSVDRDGRACFASQSRLGIGDVR